MKTTRGFFLLSTFILKNRWPKTVSFRMRCGPKRYNINKQFPFYHRDLLKTPSDFYKFVFCPIFEAAVYPCYLLSLSLSSFKKVESVVGIASFFKPLGANECVQVMKPLIVPSHSRLQAAAVEMKDIGKVIEKIDEPNDKIEEKEQSEPNGLELRNLLHLVDPLTNDPLFFKCHECGDVFESIEKQEHLDFHFAATLSRGSSLGLGSMKKGGLMKSKSTSSVVGKKKSSNGAKSSSSKKAKLKR